MESWREDTGRRGEGQGLTEQGTLAWACDSGGLYNKGSGSRMKACLDCAEEVVLVLLVLVVVRAGQAD